jgi:Undecaprenyl-phosphate glucose phosphotransferase
MQAFSEELTLKSSNFSQLVSEMGAAARSDSSLGGADLAFGKYGSKPGRSFQSSGQNKAHHLRSGAVLFALSDFSTVLATSIVAKFVYLDIYLHTQESSWLHALVGIALGLILLVSYEQMGLYRLSVLPEPLIGIGKIWGGLTTSVLVLLGTLYVLKISDQFSRGWIISWIVLATFALTVVRWRITKILKERIRCGKLRHSVAIYGSPAFATQLGAEYARTCPMVDIDGIFFASEPAGQAQASNGGLNELRAAMSMHQYDTIIIALPASERATIQKAVKSLAFYSGELLLCSDLSDYPVSVSGSRSFGNLRMDVINVVPGSEFSHVAKPLLDYVLAAAGLIALAPILAMIAIAVKLDSPGPIFFRQRRYGQDNRIFRIYKFRTMTVTEDGPVVVQAKRDDARVTRVGRVLRRTSLDELPQLINVLLGDMSLVGPRPHAIAHDDAFEEQLDLFSRRRRVRPGITGWAQINGYRGETKTIEDVCDRMRHDLYYIEHWSIWLDLEILARTPLIAARRAY